MNWIKKNRLEVLTLILILAFTAFFRFYKIDQYMTFLGDEGRDALVIKEMLEQHHFPLLGPPTSVGNMYLGPLYYYMMLPPMTVFWLNPIAAASMVAIIGTATVFLVYYLSRNWFGRLGAILASALYAVSPVNIIYSKSSWNPNPAPFFALLLILGFYQARKSRNYLWLVLSFASLAFAIQMHYLALILVPIVIVLWIFESKQVHKKHFLWGTILGILIFLFLMSPLVIFDLRHNFLNYRSLTTFFAGKDENVSFNLLEIAKQVWPIYSYNLISRYMVGPYQLISILLSIILLVPVAKFVKDIVQKKAIEWPYFVLSLWLVVGIIGLAFYRQAIYDHYLGFLNPVSYLILAGVIFLVEKNLHHNYKKVALGGLIILSGVLIVLNLIKNPLLQPPNNQLQKTQNIVRFVISEAKDQPFNFALLSAHNYDSAYQFYFEMFGSKPKQVPFEITNQLFVVCEDPVCQPINNPKYEIAAFGWSRIDQQQDLEGVKIFKLVANPH